MRGRRLTIVAAGAIVCAVLAAWSSFGASTFAGTGREGPIYGVLPSFAWLVALLVPSLALAAYLRPRPAYVAPLFLSAVLLLPWIPLYTPLSVFTWSGPAVAAVWIAIAVALAGAALSRCIGFRGRTVHQTGRAVVVAFVIAALAYGATAWFSAPQHPGGDEPHYLVIAQSLLEDHDLQIENNHRQRDYLRYFGGPLRPDYLQRGTNGQIYSIHAPGLPLLVAPVFALGGYPGVVVAILLISAAAAALAWLVAWRVTRDRTASWFAWAAVTFAAPVVLHASTVYPDPVGAAIVLAAIVALVDERARTPRCLVAIGVALALLPWLHTRFAVLAAALGIAVAGRILTDRAPRLSKLGALAAAPIPSALGWLLYFKIIYGVFDPAAPYGGATNTSVTNIGRGLLGLLVDQQFGLLANAPVLACAFFGFAAMWRHGHRRLAIELFAVIASYALVVSSFYMWWGGLSAPSRFLVPVLLVLVIPLAIWFATRRTTAAKVAGAAALLVSILMSGAMGLAEHGALSINGRDGSSRLLLWLSPSVDLTRALPSLFQTDADVAFRRAALWAIAAAVCVLAAVASERWQARADRQQRIAAAVVTIGLTAELTAMIVVSVLWSGATAPIVRIGPSGASVLRDIDPDSWQVALAYRPFRRLRLRDLPREIPLTGETPAAGPYALIQHLPPGTYEVSGRTVGAPAGQLRVIASGDSPPIEEWRVASLGATWTRDVTFPVGVAALALDLDGADPPAPGSVSPRALADVSLRAISVLPKNSRPAGDREAVAGARYGSAFVFSMGSGAWLEPPGIWVEAQRPVAFVMAPVAPSTRGVRLLLRNGPVGNQVALDSGPTHESLMLAAGEERLVELPVPKGATAIPLTLRTATGFRPSDVDHGSDDARWLGVWLETR